MAVAAAQNAGSKHNLQGARQAYYEKISEYHAAPRWEVLKGLVPPEPKTQMVPALWKFPEVENLMLEAGDVITAEEAERRVLVLENPGDPGKSRITNSLFAGIQLIMPGEIAEAHQHVSSAIRFVLKGKGAYTAVEGEKAMMEHGDFIITANWARRVVWKPPRREKSERQSRERVLVRALCDGRAAGRCSRDELAYAGNQLSV